MSSEMIAGDRGAYLDRQFNPRLRIPEFAAFFGRWRESGRTARESLGGQLDLPYGTSRAETLDFFRAPGADRPLLVFLHGGYWRALDKSDFSWIAPPYVSRG